MNLRNLFKHGLIAIFICHNAIGANPDQDDKRLVIGCRPWDTNMQSFSGLQTDDFVDFMITGAPNLRPSNFFHLDINDEGLHGSGKFSDFANSHLEKYNTIIIDWITSHHIHRKNAWTDFAKLLKSNGTLIVPVTRTSFTTGSISFETAQNLISENDLSHMFNQVNILRYNKQTFQDTCFDLLRRPNLEPGRLQSHISMDPAFILAKKQSKTTEDTKNVSESGDMTIEKSDETYPESSTTNVASSKQYKEVKFPRIDQIKDQLIEGKSTLVSETGTAFSVQTIFGFFNGFRTEAIGKGFDLKIKFVGNSVGYDGHHLFGVLDIMPVGSKFPIHLFLKSLDGYRNPFMISGGKQTENPNYYQISDPEQIKIGASLS